ncbi:hypothetical protein O181_090009 [Austropuccinia psidii MF-1]|uniref:Uncharacterized protein n=1 Tax=Austropuccinia psidii MF-1 TaxID=1389203 RepID=A0A9Q3P6F4_9BASI|nr:hypothetical protein [Austropuccinia psidii MF-1]
MAYSLLGKISHDSSLYDHVIDAMVLSMNSNIDLKQVLNKFSELLRHKNSKRDSQKSTIKEENESSTLLTTKNQFPYKLTYIMKDSKYNNKNTTHKAENCWAEHPEVHSPPHNRFKKKNPNAETHQTGLEELLTEARNTLTTSLSLFIECVDTHHMFNSSSYFTNFTESSGESISASNPLSSLICKGRVKVKIFINSNPFLFLIYFTYLN